MNEDVRLYLSDPEVNQALQASDTGWLARIFEPEMVHRYIHTKKKRTRKKYEKRILA